MAFALAHPLASEEMTLEDLYVFCLFSIQNERYKLQVTFLIYNPSTATTMATRYNLYNQSKKKKPKLKLQPRTQCYAADKRHTHTAGDQGTVLDVGQRRPYTTAQACQYAIRARRRICPCRHPHVPRT